MSRQQPRSTRPYSRVPYTTLSRSQTGQRDVDDEQGGGEEGDLATEQPEPAVDVAVEGVEEAVDDADVVHVSGPARMRKRRPRRRTWQAFASRKPWRDRLRVRDQARRPAHPWWFRYQTVGRRCRDRGSGGDDLPRLPDRKSTRLNSSH